MKNQYGTRTAAMVSVRELLGRRQANNVLESNLRESVRPWFSEWVQAEDGARVKQALKELEEPARRAAAAAYLGLEITPAR